MAVEVKVAPDERLEYTSVFLEDRRVTSQYFNLTELPDTFTGGKNAFLIAGTEYLEPNTEVIVQIRDANGRVVYTETSDGSPEYYEGISKVVAVYVYPNDSVAQAKDSTAFGPCTITILGELKFYDNNGSKTEVPEIWKGKYNVRYIGQANINPNLANTTRVRFFYRPKATITELLKPIYNVSGSSVSASAITASYANIKLSRLETFAGDVKRVKVYRTSEGTVSDFELIQDIQIEAKELLQSFEATGSVVTDTGFFNSEVLSKFWNSGSLTATLDTNQFSGSTSVKLNGNGNFTYIPKLDLSDITVYELAFDGFYTGSSQSNLEIYISGSQNGDRKIDTINGLFPTRNLTNYVSQFSLPNSEPTASLYFKQTQGNWFLKDISLRASSETVFSPNEVSFIVSNETFNFKFEFFDVNNNYIPVAVTASQTFTGGNDNLTTIASSVSAVSSSITSFSSSYFEDIFSGSNSLSGSLTSSISSSIAQISQSLSGSIQNAYSSSIFSLQTLADGNYSGSFISGSLVYAPVIGGQTGYISGKFTVGAPPNSIVLDATTSTRRIYIGTGTYNNSNTKIYLDSDGKFSLTDKLTFDGTNLSINGSGTFSGALSAASGTFTGALSGGTISIGSGNSIFKADSNGIYLGNASFNSAPFRVYLDGSLYAASATISGNVTITSGTTYDTINSKIGGGDVNGYVTSISGNAITTGTVSANRIDVSGVISAGSIIVSGNNITSLTNNAGYQANGDAKTGGSVGGWTINSSAIYSGTYTTSGYSSSGITLYGGGSIHAQQFYIDTSGNAFFKGSITGASGTFSGDITGASGTFGGVTINGSGVSFATTTINSSGINVNSGTLDVYGTGTVLRVPNGQIAADSVAGFTVTGQRVTTGSGGLYAVSPIEFVGLGVQSTGVVNLVIDSNSFVYKASSSRQYKKNIESTPLSDAKRILNLDVRSFNGKEQSDEDSKVVGFVAEEVLDLGYDDLVVKDNDGTTMSVYYQSIFASMVKVVQDLNKRVEELEAKISGSL
jgi:hypothetical protein